MAYFTNYYTNYFDVEVAGAAEVVRAGGGLAPSLKEWQEYLKRWHELRRQVAAEKAARNGLRAFLREQMFPPAPTVAAAVERAVEKVRIEERAETRIRLLHIDNTDLHLEIARVRLEMAELLVDIRRRAKKIKKIKKRKRDEEAILLLWDG